MLCVLAGARCVEVVCLQDVPSLLLCDLNQGRVNLHLCLSISCEAALSTLTAVSLL